MISKGFIHKRLIILCSVFSLLILFNTSFNNYGYGLPILRDSIKIRPEILQAVDTIAKANGVENEHIGQDGSESKRWAPFKELCDSATNSELRALINYPNAAVRCYSFHALALRNDTTLFSILLSHLLDTTQVSVQNYDVIFNQITEDYLIDVVTPKLVDLKAYKLNINERQKLDSILIYKKQVNLYAKENLLSELKPNFKYYSRIREMALKEDNSVALLALSRYKKKSDVDIINSYLNKRNPDYYVVYAVREFPDNKFYPGLVRLFEKEWKQKLYDY